MLEFRHERLCNCASHGTHEKAREAIVAELKQMLRLKVWHPVHYSNLSAVSRKAILRTSMFLKEKFTANGLFEKLKARLVTGGDQQDKEFYENLSSSTAATSSVMVVVWQLLQLRSIDK